MTTTWAGGVSTCLGNVEGDVQCFGEGLSLGNPPGMQHACGLSSSAQVVCWASGVH